MTADSRFNRIVKEVLTKAGIGSVEHYGTHSLRKTFANRIYATTGHDINLTRAVLGHANVSTTQRYLYVDEQDVTNAILAVGRRPAPRLTKRRPAKAA